jgi:ribosomal protein L32E
VHDLYSIDAKKQAAVIAAGVGKKLRSELLKAAKDKNIKILN